MLLLKKAPPRNGFFLSPQSRRPVFTKSDHSSVLGVTQTQATTGQQSPPQKKVKPPPRAKRKNKEEERKEGDIPE